MFFGMAIYGSGTPTSKILTQNFPIFVASEFRVIAACLFLLPFVIKDFKSLFSLTKKEYLYIFLISLFGMFFFSITMLYGMTLIPAAIGSIVMSTMPAVVMTGSILFMKDHLTKTKFFSIFFAVLGLLIINLSRETLALTGDYLMWILGVLLIFGAVCCEAAYTLLGMKVSQKVDPVKTAFISSFIAIFLFLPFFIYDVSGFNFSQVSFTEWIYLTWWGAGVLGIGTLLWYNGVKHVKGSVAAGFMGVMAVSALVLSYILVGETFQWIHLAGISLELVAIGFAVKARAEKQKQQDS